MLCSVELSMKKSLNRVFFSGEKKQPPPVPKKPKDRKAVEANGKRYQSLERKKADERNHFKLYRVENSKTRRQNTVDPDGASE